MSKCKYCLVNDADVFGKFCSFVCMVLSALEEAHDEIYWCI